MRADESAITIITAMQDRERAHGMQGRECALAYLPSLRTKFCTVSSSTASRDVAAGPCPVAGSWRPSTAMRAEPGEISVSDDHCNILTGYLVYLLPSFALDTAIAILHSHRGPWTSAREPCQKPPTCMLRRSAHYSNVKPRSIPRAKHSARQHGQVRCTHHSTAHSRACRHGRPRGSPSHNCRCIAGRLPAPRQLPGKAPPAPSPFPRDGQTDGHTRTSRGAACVAIPVLSMQMACDAVFPSMFLQRSPPTSRCRRHMLKFLHMPSESPCERLCDLAGKKKAFCYVAAVVVRLARGAALKPGISARGWQLHGLRLLRQPHGRRGRRWAIFNFGRPHGMPPPLPCAHCTTVVA